MSSDRIEGKWIDTFARVFELSKVETGTRVALLTETQSRDLNVVLAELALERLGANWCRVTVPTPRQTAPVPVRSTGASQALAGQDAAIAALASVELVVDLTLEGLLHAAELPRVLADGARVLMVSNEHPDALERLLPDPALTDKVKLGLRKLKAANVMQVTSPAGTDLVIDVSAAPLGAAWGYAERPGQVAHWPAGLCLCFPEQGSVRGTLVLAPGDVNLTFKRYIESPVRLEILDDYIMGIDGDGLDAELFRSYIAAWDDRDAYAVSHVGWGMNPAARWEALAFYDKADTNGTELRAFAGNFLYSTGANETAGRHTAGHFDLPMRGCSISLDDEMIVVDGKLQGDLA